MTILEDLASLAPEQAKTVINDMVRRVATKQASDEEIELVISVIIEELCQ